MGSLSARLTLSSFVVICLATFSVTLLVSAGLGLAPLAGLLTAFAVTAAVIGCIYLDLKKAEAKTRAMWEARLAQPAPAPVQTAEDARRDKLYDDIFEGRRDGEEEMLANHKGSWDNLRDDQISRLMGN